MKVFNHYTHPIELEKNSVKLFSSLFIVLLTIFAFSSITVSAQDEDEKDPVELFNKAQNSHEKGDLAAALKLYEEALEAAPDFPEAEYQRGSILVILGRRNEAEKAFLRAIEIRPGWSLPKISLAELFVSARNFAQAEKILTDVLKSEPDNYEVYPLLTDVKIGRKISDEELKVFLKEIAGLNSSRSNALLFASQGAIERSLGDFAGARRNLEQALTLQPNNSFALSELVETTLVLKDFAAAERTAQKLVKLRPNSRIYQLQLAKVFASRSKISEALFILDTLDASNPEVAAFRSLIENASTEDVAQLEKALSANPRESSVLSRLCVITRKNPAKALDYCRRAAEVEPNNINHAVGYAAALVQARQFPAAESLLRRLLAIEPENYTVRANLAATLFESKNYAAAKPEYEWIIRTKPDLAIAYYFLAIANDNLQQYKEAFTNYQTFLKLADSNLNQLEIDKVNLRLPILEKQIKKLK